MSSFIRVYLIFSAYDVFSLYLYNYSLLSSAVLRNVEWKFLTDVSAQPIGLVFKAQEIQLFVFGFIDP